MTEEKYSFKKELAKAKKLAEAAGWAYDDDSKRWAKEGVARKYVSVIQLITREELDQ